MVAAVDVTRLEAALMRPMASALPRAAALQHHGQRLRGVVPPGATGVKSIAASWPRTPSCSSRSDGHAKNGGSAAGAVRSVSAGGEVAGLPTVALVGLLVGFSRGSTLVRPFSRAARRRGLVVRGTASCIEVRDESKPRIVVDGGGADVSIAWKPAGMSTMRLRGGLPSAFETWAAGVDGLAGEEASEASAEAPAVSPRLGRAVAGLVFVSRRQELMYKAQLALEAGVPRACATLCAVVQGCPSEEALSQARAADAGLDIRVLRTSEGLRLGTLSILELRPTKGALPGEKELRRLLAHLGHPVLGKGGSCAHTSGISGTYLAVTGLGLGDDVSAEVPVPKAFSNLLDRDAEKLRRKGAGEAWSGRTEHWTGEAVDFDGLALKVPPGVFVPRHSGFQIMEAACSLPLAPSPRVLDCGTGSGALLCGVLNRVADSSGVAIDLDPKAVAAARVNLDSHALAGETRLLPFDEIASLPGTGLPPFDLVLSNPPYIPDKVAKHVAFARELASQPLAAFVGGEDGLDAYRLLADRLLQPGVMSQGGWAVMGCQPERSALVADIFSETRRFEVHENLGHSVVLKLAA
eukprot:TRINITY_DN60544_c0_g1_i2.p1 TRINITY_DN60544_c0_g1~~TRINITY_DN60544_c0_g1_i2.p1  ORF type:complete len:602 (-),score=125.57 TRINITY_DN60544_c0_g1_i2:91-1827(-)